MSTLIRTDQVPAADRLDFVREMTAATWVPMSAAPSWATTGGEFRASGLGAMQVVVMDIMPITVRRTPKLISQADPDLLKMVLVCGGDSCVVAQDGRQAPLSRPADFAIYSTPASLRGGVRGRHGHRPTRDDDLHVPAVAAAAVPEPARAAGRRAFPGRRGPRGSDLAVPPPAGPQCRSLQPGRGGPAVTAALEVLATRLAHELDVRDWGTPEARRHALLTTVQAFIQQHLGDPGLSPAMIAAAHHVSLRSLHQLFHDEGLTVAGWIRQRRLESCRQDLADPALADRPVAAIAARWGFSSAGDFSRVFRAVHGSPPRSTACLRAL